LELDPTAVARTASLRELAAIVGEPSVNGDSQLVRDLWLNLERDPGRLVDKIRGAPIAGLIRFSERAAAYHQETLMAECWERVATDPGPLLRGALEASVGDLGLLLDLLRAYRQTGFEQQIWRLFETDAQHFAERVLESGSGLWDVALLLAKVPGAGERTLGALLSTICAPGNRNRLFTRIHDGLLAGALYTIATTQSPEIIQLFWGRSLDWRILHAVSRMSSSDDSKLCHIVQLIGGAQLAGRWIKRASFSRSDALMVRLGELPARVLLHRPGFDGIEPMQAQLWLGLRVACALAERPIPIATTVLDETIARWRVTLTRSAGDPGSTIHRVNRSMLGWLEECHRERGVLASHGRGRLWELVGFPRNGPIASDSRAREPAATRPTSHGPTHLKVSLIDIARRH
jgi:hypothetical protein